MGTKVKSIRLVGGDHEVDCKMDAGNFMLKAEFLKKSINEQDLLLSPVFYNIKGVITYGRSANPNE